MVTETKYSSTSNFHTMMNTMVKMLMIVGDDDDDDNDDNLLAFIALLLFNTFVRNLLYYRFAISTTTDVDEKRV